MSESQDDKGGNPVDRRKFLKVGGLGAAAMAAGASGRAPLEAEEVRPPGEAAQSSPAQAQAPQRPAPRTSRFNRNFDPVPASMPSMNFAVFTDTHVGQHNRSPQWDFAQHLDKLADDIMDRTLPC